MDSSDTQFSRHAAALLIGLAGPSVSHDLNLTRCLQARHCVTLLGRLDLMIDSPVMATLDVLVMECAQQAERTIEFVRMLKRHVPKLIVVLINGGISQFQLATAFHLGIEDYFPANYDPVLLAERIENLVAAKRRNASNAS
jgi:DNA-binding NarL/FixJ family response regulator